LGSIRKAKPSQAKPNQAKPSQTKPSQALFFLIRSAFSIRKASEGIRKAPGFYFLKLLGSMRQAKPSQALFFKYAPPFLFEKLLKVFEKLRGSIF